MLKSKQKSIAILAIVLVLCLGAVYLIVSPIGNGGGNGGTAQTSAGAGLASYAVGEMANFRPAGPDETLPEVAFEDGEGRRLTLSDFRGKLILLNLWATWCAPCREEMPALDRLEAAQGGPKFEVVALSVDRDGLDLVRKFHAEVGIKALATYIDPKGRANFTLKAFGLPTTLLIAPDGRLLGRLIGPAVWDGPDAIALIEAALKGPN